MRTFLSAVCLASVVTLVCYTDWSLFEGGGRFNGWMRKCVRAVCPLKPPKQATCTLLKIEWNWWVTPQWRKWNVFECQIFHGVLIGLNDCSNFSMDSINYDFSNHRHQGWRIALYELEKRWTCDYCCYFVIFSGFRRTISCLRRSFVDRRQNQWILMSICDKSKIPFAAVSLSDVISARQSTTWRLHGHVTLEAVTQHSLATKMTN